MTSQVAIIGSDEAAESVTRLSRALKSQGITSIIAPTAQPREVLRWAMNLEPDQCALCIFADTDGRITASLTTALHPSITPIAWCPSPADPSHIAAILSEAATLVCFAKDPQVVAQLARNIIRSATAPAAAASPFPAKHPEARSAKIETLTPAIKPEIPEALSPDDNDLALYRQLETAMALPIKKYVRPEPAPVQKAALDFSMPLRRLMTHGQKLAGSRSHVEVLGLHYLAALDEPYLSAFTSGGLDIALVKDYLSGFDSGEDITGEPVISDEVFEAVSHAKQRARANETACVRVADFLHGLLHVTSGTLSDILEDAQLTTDNLLEVLAAMEAPDETCAEPFFNSSSLDQASFYQFDSAQVRDVEVRLRDLPGFKKAAERVAESRGRQESDPDTITTTATAQKAPWSLTNIAVSPAAEPPDKPEILKVTGDFPSVDVIEHVADRLLEGHIIAFPSDIMFVLAADASNPAAVARLRETAGLPNEKPLSILIHSTTQLKHLVKADLDALEPLLDEHWPGPLTLLFKSANAIGRHISPTGTVAVRQPADNTSLAILSMLGRPLAVTSWQKPKDTLASQAAIIIEGETPLHPVKTTVVDLTQTPWQILREGALPGQSVLRFYPA